MLSEPKVEHRNELPYAAIRRRVTMQEIPKDLPPLIFQVLNWVKENKLEEAGPAFFRYLSMNNGVLEVEVGVPLSKLPTGSGEVNAGSFPAGKYLVANHIGSYNNLPKSHMAMDAYVKEHGLKHGTVNGDNGQIWGTRAEFYITDPMVEKDESKWITELALLLQD